MFLIKNDKGLLTEVGFSKNFIIQLFSDFENILTEEYENHLNFVKNEEENFVEIILS